MSQIANNLIDRLKSELSIKKDKDLCLLLGIKHNTLSTWKKRDTLDFNKILDLCEKYNLNLNYIFFEEEPEVNEPIQKVANEVLVENPKPSKGVLNCFVSTKLVNTNRNIALFYHQFNESEDVNGELIIGQQISSKKLVENKWYIIESTSNKFTLDTISFIKNSKAKSVQLLLNEHNETIEMSAILNSWQVLERFSDIVQHISTLTAI